MRHHHFKSLHISLNVFALRSTPLFSIFTEIVYIMSFGYSVGDILTTLKLADDLKKRFAQAPKEFKAISDE